jgi:hypothetical protein
MVDRLFIDLSGLGSAHLADYVFYSQQEVSWVGVSAIEPPFLGQVGQRLGAWVCRIS